MDNFIGTLGKQSNIFTNMSFILRTKDYSLVWGFLSAITNTSEINCPSRSVAGIFIETHRGHYANHHLTITVKPVDGKLL